MRLAKAYNERSLEEGRRVLIIAIDGPSGVGKSTVARRLAGRLGYRYLDTGALYRAVAWKVAQAGLDGTDPVLIGTVLQGTRIQFQTDPHDPRVSVDGVDTTAAIRTPEISHLASVVSAVPTVREWLLPVQHRYGAERNIVVEGRDIGTRVFPHAEVKFFLDADTDVRVARRQRELIAAGHAPTLTHTRRDMETRDTRDRTRSDSPLATAEDAIVIDTSSLNADEVVERIVAVLSSKS